MSDRDDPKNGDLILSGNRSLAIKRLDLVKRGLELVQKLKKRQLEVVIGNFDDPINELISEIIKEVTENKYDLNVRSFFYGEELLEQAENGAADLFILILNNIRFRPVHHIKLERLENSLQLITQIKTTYGRPVIVLSGIKDEEGSSIVARAKIVGDFFFPLPFETDVFIQAIEKCVNMLHGFDEAPRKRLEGSGKHNIT
jgi:hypothetical protein